MKKWYQDQKGDTSTMRIIAMLASVTGSFAVIAGSIIVLAGFPEGAQIAVSGAGMTGLSGVSKAWQAKNGK